MDSLTQQDIDDFYQVIVDILPSMKPEPKKDYAHGDSDQLAIVVNIQCLREDFFSLRIMPVGGEIVHFQGSFDDIKFLLRGKLKDAYNGPQVKMLSEPSHAADSFKYTMTYQWVGVDGVLLSAKVNV